MAGRQSEMNAWIRIDPEKVIGMIRKALDDSRGDKKEAAKTLGVSFVTLWRTIRRLGMSSQADSITEKWETVKETERINRQKETAKKAKRLSRGKK